MEHIIRKVIKEVSDSKEESIKKIEDKKKYIGTMLPIISEYFEGTFGDDLFELIVTNDRKTHFGGENYSTDTYLLKFYFNEIPKENKFNIRRSIINRLNNLFDIDITRYGVPLNIEIYVKQWKQI
jgi:hypothetical protein